jgi:hypothetical protein
MTIETTHKPQEPKLELKRLLGFKRLTDDGDEAVKVLGATINKVSETPPPK